MPGSIPMIFDIEPSLRTCCICSRKSSRVKSPPVVSFSAALSAWSWSKAFSACSIRVITSPMSRMREAIRSGWKTSKSVSFSPAEANMTGLPVMPRIDSAAPPRASPSSLVRTTPSYPTPSRNACAVVTASCPIIASTTNRISSGSTASRMSAACCIMLGVDAEASRGVDDHDVVQLATGLVDRVAGDLHRVADTVAGLGSEDGYAGALAVDLELVDGVRALEVGRDQHGLLALLLEPQRELRGERGLAGALEPGEHDHGRGVLGVAQAARLAAEDLDQLLVDDLDDLLGGVQRRADLLAASPLLDRVHELSNHRERDVGLEQGDPDLASGRVDVGLGEAALAAEVLEGLGEPVGERGEQVSPRRS